MTFGSVSALLPLFQMCVSVLVSVAKALETGGNNPEARAWIDPALVARCVKVILAILGWEFCGEAQSDKLAMR